MRETNLIELSYLQDKRDSDSKELVEMCAKAEAFIRSFRWCPPIRRTLVGYGLPGVVAVVLFEFAEKIEGMDERLWVIVGDLPSAYIVVEKGDDAADALSRYCDLMTAWVISVRTDERAEDVFPVDAPRTLANANSLESRISFLREKVFSEIPSWPEEIRTTRHQ